MSIGETEENENEANLNETETEDNCNETQTEDNLKKRHNDYGDETNVGKRTRVDHCEVCLRVFVGERIPFENCNYCLASPSYHHGRCCSRKPR